jgi:predicted transposase/invertase (TIGR01784 family)
LTGARKEADKGFRQKTGQEKMPKKPGNLHDAMFRAWFSAPEAAGLLFSEQMPERLFALFKSEPPELMPGSFIDDGLAEHRTDLLYRASLKEGGVAYIYLLIEHKSYCDRRTPLQLLRYLSNIWTKMASEKGWFPLAPVISLVFYHGGEPWSVAPTFHGLFRPPGDRLRPHIPEFSYELIDLGRIDDENLSGNLRQRAHLTALKYNTRNDMREVGLPRVVRLFKGLPDVDIKRILLYILNQHQGIGRDDLNRALLEHAPQRKDEIMNVFLKEIEDEGKAKWMAAGEAKGKAETLLKLLAHRFGKLPKEVERRIRGADAETLDSWALRILDAKSPKDVIAN